MPKYFKRFMNFQSLDFETAVWEMFNLLVQPKRVYKLLYYQRQTKNKWSRDDPSFAIILSLLLTISAICWGLTYSTNIITIFKLILYMVIVDFLLVGLVVATIGWILANNILSQSNTNSQSGSYDSNKWWVNNKYIRFIFPSDSILEWAYCFDVHCNSYLIIWCGLYLIQFFLLPLLRLNNWISCLIGNTLYLASLSYYFVITFYGYNMLPFLTRTEFLLVPIPIFAIFWLILTLSGFNVANYMSDSYFG
ncbi:hypothetical protein CANARDRAFT_177651 [[Candida] arabinofermentans NRRL YB-2248]|uniref:UNC-50-like protein n=1 Tax=[Candida] arabinofermentans NRRL YB-2248 TaxID=983967 RepID=A0A1E4SVI0_9ASCO|nr:hypothetical protein CANARDRAFT_177651 [[Candida] arabinofermentans NRRL YB-2248]